MKIPEAPRKPRDGRRPQRQPKTMMTMTLVTVVRRGLSMDGGKSRDQQKLGGMLGQIRQGGSKKQVPRRRRAANNFVIVHAPDEELSWFEKSWFEPKLIRDRECMIMLAHVT